MKKVHVNDMLAFADRRGWDLGRGSKDDKLRIFREKVLEAYAVTADAEVSRQEEMEGFRSTHSEEQNQMGSLASLGDSSGASSRANSPNPVEEADPQNLVNSSAVFSRNPSPTPSEVSTSSTREPTDMVVANPVTAQPDESPVPHGNASNGSSVSSGIDGADSSNPTTPASSAPPSRSHSPARGVSFASGTTGDGTPRRVGPQTGAATGEGGRGSGITSSRSTGSVPGFRSRGHNFFAPQPSMGGGGPRASAVNNPNPPSPSPRRQVPQPPFFGRGRDVLSDEEGEVMEPPPKRGREDENSSDKRPLTPGARGFLLSSVIGRQVAEGNLRAQVRDAAELFDPTIPAVSSEGRLLLQSLHRGTVSNVGDLVLALPTLSGMSFGADALATSIFLIYRAVAFRETAVTLRLLDHHGIDGAVTDPLWATEGDVLLPRDGALLFGEPLRGSIDASHPFEKQTPGSETKDKKSYFEEFNRKSLLHTDKANIESRAEASRGPRRLMHHERLSVVSNNGVDVPLPEGWKKLEQRGTSFLYGEPRAEARLVGDDASRFFRNLQGLPCVRSDEIFVKFFSMGMANPSYGVYKPNLQAFAEVPLDVGDDDVSLAKPRLIAALDRWESFMIFTCGMQLRGVTDALRANLFSGPLSSLHWEPKYVRFLIERALASFFQDVLQTPVTEYRRRPGYETLDISTPEGIPAVLRHEFGAIIPSDPEQNHFWRHFAAATSTSKSTPHGSAPAKRSKKTGTSSTRSQGSASSVSPSAPLSTPTNPSSTGAGNRPAGSALPSSAPVAAGNGGGSGSGTGQSGSRSTLACISKLMHDLSVLNLKGNVYQDCSKGPGSCIFRHVDITSTPKPQLVQMVQALATPRPNGNGPLLKPDVVQQALDKIAALP